MTLSRRRAPIRAIDLGDDGMAIVQKQPAGHWQVVWRLDPKTGVWERAETLKPGFSEAPKPGFPETPKPGFPETPKSTERT